MTSVNRSKQQWLLSAILLLALSSWGAVAQAADPVAKLIFAINGVEVVRANGNRAAAPKGTEVFEGDKVITAANGRAQLLFVDGARTALRPGTELLIEKYQSAAEDSQTAVVVANEASAVLGLLKGGMRAVSGNMTKQNPDALTVKTPVATMGIRGTDFTLVLTSDSGGELVLHVSVRDGIVRISNSLGHLDVAAGEFAKAAKNVLPTLLLNPPAALFDEAPQGSQRDDNSNSPNQSLGSRQAVDDSDHNAPLTAEGPKSPPPPAPPSEPALPEHPPMTTDGQNLEDPDSTPDDNNNQKRHVAMSGAQGPNQADIITAQASNTSEELALAENGDLHEAGLRYDDSVPQAGGTDTTFSVIGVNGPTAEVADRNADSASGFEWGRWHDGSFAANPAPSGNDQIVVLNGDQSVHWVYGAAFEGEPLSNITAAISYENVGGTSPTDNFGNVGTLQSAFLFADFTEQAVFVDFALDMNGAQWVFSGSGQMADGGVRAFTGDIDSGFIGSSGTVLGGSYNGSFSPNIVPAGDSLEQAPAGAGLSYSVAGQDPNSNSPNSVVSGVVVFGNPVAGSGF